MEGIEYPFDVSRTWRVGVTEERYKPIIGFWSFDQKSIQWFQRRWVNLLSLVSSSFCANFWMICWFTAPNIVFTLLVDVEGIFEEQRIYVSSIPVCETCCNKKCLESSCRFTANSTTSIPIFYFLKNIKMNIPSLTNVTVATIKYYWHLWPLLRVTIDADVVVVDFSIDLDWNEKSKVAL